MARKTTCEHMCTCCITWWPCCPAFCWIEPCSHSWAAGYVTDWADGFSICSVWGEQRCSRCFVRAEENTVSAAAAGCVAPRFPSPLSPTLSGYSDTLTQVQDAPYARLPELITFKSAAQGFCRSFSATLCNARHTAVAPVYITCDYSVSICWFYQCWLESVRGIWLPEFRNRPSICFIINELSFFSFSSIKKKSKNGFMA